MQTHAESPLIVAHGAIRNALYGSPFLKEELQKGRWRDWISTAMQGAAAAVGTEDVKAAEAMATEGGARMVVIAETRLIDVTVVGDVTVDHPAEPLVVKVKSVSLARMLDVEAAVELGGRDFDGSSKLLVNELRARTESGYEIALPLADESWGTRSGYPALLEVWRERLV